LRNLVGLDEADAGLAHLGGGVLAGVDHEESRRGVGVDAALPFDDQVDLGAS
jgi:hypothetical protein